MDGNKRSIVALPIPATQCQNIVRFGIRPDKIVSHCLYYPNNEQGPSARIPTIYWAWGYLSNQNLIIF